MENTGLSRYTISFGLSLAVASVANGLLVIAKEKIPAVMTGMQKLASHHWVAHSFSIISLFVLLGWLFAQANGGKGIKLTGKSVIIALVSGVTAGGLIIVGFYLFGG